MPREIYPSSYECDCGHLSHFFENTIREAKARSQRKALRLMDGEPNEHTIVFHHGEMTEIICPQAKSSTRVRRHVNAPRASVYRALLDAQAVAAWKVPTGMSSHVHAFDAREGGAFRVSLTYDAPTGTGKTTAHTDTYHGYFAKLVPDEQVVEVVEFETTDPAIRGEMTITITLTDAAGGTEVLAVHDGLPPGVSPADNEAGWREALAKLAALVEAGPG